MGQRIRLKASIFALLVAMVVTIPLVFAAEFSREAAAKYILATAKAFRRVYSQQILGQGLQGRNQVR